MTLSKKLLEEIFGPGVKNLPPNRVTELFSASKMHLKAFQEYAVNGQRIPENFLREILKIWQKFSNDNNHLENLLRHNNPILNQALDKTNSIPQHPSFTPKTPFNTNPLKTKPN
ncbi:MAG: hypothetical protein ACNA7Y_04875 [Gammaproteobacteria bacterium]